MTIGTRIKKFFSSVAKFLSDFTYKHWIVTAMIFTGSSWWFSLFLGYWGVDLGLLVINNDQNNVPVTKLTPLGLAITIVICLILIVLTLISRYREAHNTDKKNLIYLEAGYNLFDKVLMDLNYLCRSKYSSQINEIVNIENDQLEPPIIYSNPCKQLEVISNEIADCISFTLSEKGRKFNRDDLYVSIAYNFPKYDRDSWHWADVNSERGLSIAKLCGDNTTFSYLLKTASQKEPSVFFNSKQQAYDEKHYLPDDCDKYDFSNKLKGSIACFKIVIKKGDVDYIIAVVNISSYSKKFVDESVSNADIQQDVNSVYKNIENVIIKEFSERIKIELCNYYIQFLRKKWEAEHANSGDKLNA